MDEETQELLMKTCSILASRYNDSQEYQDLYQEGFLAGWEAMANGADVPQAIGAMRSAMRDYKNITLKPVSIPKSGAVYSLLKRLKNLEGSDPQGNTERALMEALTGSAEGVQPSTLGLVKESEEKLIEKDLYHYITNHLWVYLTAEEATIVHLMFVEDYTQEEVAQELKMGQGTVSKSVRSGLMKLKKALEQVTSADNNSATTTETKQQS